MNPQLRRVMLERSGGLHRAHIQAVAGTHFYRLASIDTCCA